MDPSDDIAITGFAFRLPQDVDDDAALWKVLQSRRNLMTAGWPASRLEGMAAAPAGLPGHYIRRDVAAFDAPFFSVTGREAAAMDPIQRWTLEVAYQAFERAGIPVESLRGTSTAVFSASMMEDYSRMAAADPESVERTAVTGCTVACVTPNRVSWYFDLRGPSVHVNTACSSSLTAVDLACASLRRGDADRALVTGANLLLDPAMFGLLDRQGFLAADGLCRSFDRAASGYSRGEGVLAIVLKPVTAAVRDGDVIRAVIRASGSNQDGRTPSLTRPSASSQEKLIRAVYARAGLPLAETRYVEAHGTGTPVGDPIEARAIGRVFRRFRSADEPLYMGSVKANVGHLEGASGLAGLVKAVLTLERGVIPPAALLKDLNPELDAGFYHLAVPFESVPWPGPADAPRRASVNSFGFGGSNTHVVLEDAMHYLRDRGLDGHHCTTADPADPAVGVAVDIGGGDGDGDSNKPLPISDNTVVAASSLRLLVWSAASEATLGRTMRQHDTYFRDTVAGRADRLDRLAYTLGARRSQLLWRTFAVVGARSRPPFSAARPVRSGVDGRQLGLVFVFTGQGAQYADMGSDLAETFPIFAETLKRVDAEFRAMGCKWSLFDELRCADRIDRPEYSQPLCSAVQLGLVELLRSVGVVPKAVVGHSSGEIAAAYASGALSLPAACRVAYYRGQLAQRLKSSTSNAPGAMLSINVAEAKVNEYLSGVGGVGGAAEVATSICVACVNSPGNCTLSGPEPAIDAVKARADSDGIFAAKLRTGVAYHSAAMLAVADEYRALMAAGEGLETGGGGPITIPMISTVTATAADAASLRSPQYWVDNMVLPVRFAEAVRRMAREPVKLGIVGGLGIVTDLVEVGPHPALRRPALDSVAGEGGQGEKGGSAVRYASALFRGRSATETVLELVGQLFSLGYRSVDVTAANGQEKEKAAPTLLVDCPEYPFDHSSRYWSESRISRDWRLRVPVRGKFLGVRASDWNPLEPRWRSLLSVETASWIGDHVIGGAVVYPAGGLLVMAMEAAQEMVASAPARQPVGYLIREAEFVSPIIVPEAWADRVETEVRLRRRQTNQRKGEGRGEEEEEEEEEETASSFDIIIYSHGRGQWTECFRALVEVDYRDSDHAEASFHFGRVAEACERPVDVDDFYRRAAQFGLQYGDRFKLLLDARWSGAGSAGPTAVARVGLPQQQQEQQEQLMDPAVIDVGLQVLRIGAGQPPSAAVAVRVADAWFAASGWQIAAAATATESVRWVTSAARKEGSALCALANDGAVLCTIGSVTTAIVPLVASPEEESEDSDDGAKKTLLHAFEWRPQLSLLDDPDQLALACPAKKGYEADESDMVANYGRMCEALDLVTVRALRDVAEQSDGGGSRPGVSVPEGLRAHVAWMARHAAAMSPDRRRVAETATEAEVKARLAALDSAMPTWRLFTTCARRLPDMLADRVDPLEVVFGDGSDGHADVFYAELFRNLWADGRLAGLLDLAAHQNPALRILEVGAGTGGMTGHVLNALAARESRTGAPAFAEYVYSDVSPAFFERARQRWPDLEASGRLSCRTLDLARPIQEQGFVPESYDLVIAASVMHAVPDLGAAVRNVRRALRPGTGRLILLEVVNPADVATNFMAGLLPGWWVATEEWRSHSPAITEDSWDRCLRASGFSGNDLVIRDYKHDECHITSVLISTAVVSGEAPLSLPSTSVAASASTSAATSASTSASGSPLASPSLSPSKLQSESQSQSRSCSLSLLPLPLSPPPPRSGRLVLVVADEDDTELANLVRRHLDPNGDRDIATCAFSRRDQLAVTLEGLAGGGDDAVICLAEVGRPPLLATLTEEGFGCLQLLVERAPKLLWATAGGGGGDKDGGRGDDANSGPDYALARGFFHCIRAEQPDHQIVTISVGGPYVATTAARNIGRVFRDAFGGGGSGELEYVVRHDGLITTGRAIEDVAGNDALRRLLSPQLRNETWARGPAGLRLAAEPRGGLESLRFVVDDDDDSCSELQSREVEVEAQAWSVDRRDVLSALGRGGRDQQGQLGSDCAGVVVRVGRDCDPSLLLRPGDRVCMAAPGSLRKHTRAHQSQVCKIPDSLSFEAAVAGLLPAMTACHALVHVARLRAGDRVLIHSAGSAVGQMAIQMAKLQGADVFGTASSAEKRRFLVDVLAIREDHVFSSRASSLAQAVMGATDGAGVDVVLNSIAGDAILRASCECLGRNGRFVELCRANVEAGATLPLSLLAGRNVSFAAVDATALLVDPGAGALVKEAVELLAGGKIQPAEPLRVFGISDVAEAFRQAQSQDTGRVVIRAAPEAVVPLFRDHQSWTFDPNASYLVAGGSGGLGRAISRWMADRGARYLILPSRSGAGSGAAADAVAKLVARGVRVVAPRCDVACEASLAAALAECAAGGMPPIRGCINAAMVLQDAIFSNMTFAQWETAVRSKVQTSWNLHRLLPANLDFFVLLSSLIGVVGHLASSNYAAGCGFQDALARYRVGRGEAAVSLDIGWMSDIGIIAETDAYTRQRRDADDMKPIREVELIAALSLCCDPAAGRERGRDLDRCQVPLGLRTPADFLIRGRAPPPLLDRPLFAAFSYLPGSGSDRAAAAAGDQSAAVPAGVLFQQAADPAERAHVVVRALAARLARAMSISADDVELSKPLSAYGVDSLMAVDLRNWIAREFGAPVAVLDIMGGVPIAGVADLVVAKCGGGGGAQ